MAGLLSWSLREPCSDHTMRVFTESLFFETSLDTCSLPRLRGSHSVAARDELFSEKFAMPEEEEKLSSSRFSGPHPLCRCCRGRALGRRRGRVSHEYVLRDSWCLCSQSQFELSSSIEGAHLVLSRSPSQSHEYETRLLSFRSLVAAHPRLMRHPTPRNSPTIQSGLFFLCLNLSNFLVIPSPSS